MTERNDAEMHAAVERFGRLDIAFNNAGIEQPIKPAAEITDEEYGEPPTGTPRCVAQIAGTGRGSVRR